MEEVQKPIRKKITCSVEASPLFYALLG